MCFSIAEKTSPVFSTIFVPACTSSLPFSIACMACAVSSCMPVMMAEIFCAAVPDCSASFRTSSATTAKPLPASPALAASMAAFKANRFVCSAIPEIASTIFPISLERSPKVSTTLELAVICVAIFAIAFMEFATAA